MILGPSCASCGSRATCPGARSGARRWRRCLLSTIWEARQRPLRNALKRHTSTGLWALLLLAGRAERGIKGMGERHDPWLALDEMCMRLAGRG